MERPIMSLTREDCESIVSNLDASIVLLDKNVGRRTLQEVKMRSVISVLRAEMAKAAKADTTIPPF
jgi:hypothetical protein